MFGRPLDISFQFVGCLIGSFRPLAGLILSVAFDYVGPQFAEEARRIHYGEVDAHGIYGEATDNESRELAEEGIKVGRIPWVPTTDA